MKPIDDSEGPYALASFLNPTTRVSAAASRNDSPNDLFDDPTSYTMSGAYVLPGEKWYIGAEYAKSNLDDAPPVSFSDPKGYGVHAGRYLGANTTLELRLGQSEQKSSLTCPPGVFCIGLPVEIELTTDSVGLEVFHVRRFRSLTYSLQGGVSERDADIDIRPSTVSGIRSRRTVSRAPVLGRGRAIPDRPTRRARGLLATRRRLDVDSYDVGATWFFKPRIAVQFSLSRVSNHDPRRGSAVPRARGCDSSAGCSLRFRGGRRARRRIAALRCDLDVIDAAGRRRNGRCHLREALRYETRRPHGWLVLSPRGWPR